MMSEGLITKQRKEIKMMTLDEMYWTASVNEMHIAEHDEQMADAILVLREIERNLKKVVITDTNKLMAGRVKWLCDFLIRNGLKAFLRDEAGKKTMSEMTSAELYLVLEDMEKKYKHHYKKPVELKIGGKYRLYKQNREVEIVDHDNWGFIGVSGSGYDVHHMSVRPEDVKEVIA